MSERHVLPNGDVVVPVSVQATVTFRAFVLVPFADAEFATQEEEVSARIASEVADAIEHHAPFIEPDAADDALYYIDRPAGGRAVSVDVRVIDLIANDRMPGGPRTTERLVEQKAALNASME